MPSRQARRQEETYFQVMRTLHVDAHQTQRELARRVGVSLGGINYCLSALIEKGWVKVQNFSNSGNKLGYAYLLTPSGLAAKTRLARQFLKRKIEEYEALKTEIADLRSESAQPVAGESASAVMNADPARAR